MVVWRSLDRLQTRELRASRAVLFGVTDVVATLETRMSCSLLMHQCYLNLCMNDEDCNGGNLRRRSNVSDTEAVVAAVSPRWSMRTHLLRLSLASSSSSSSTAALQVRSCTHLHPHILNDPAQPRRPLLSSSHQYPQQDSASFCSTQSQFQHNDKPWSSGSPGPTVPPNPHSSIRKTGYWLKSLDATSGYYDGLLFGAWSRSRLSIRAWSYLGPWGRAGGVRTAMMSVHGAEYGVRACGGVSVGNNDASIGVARFKHITGVGFSSSTTIVAFGTTRRTPRRSLLRCTVRAQWT